MKSCPQTENQSVFEHCESVNSHTSELINYLNNSSDLVNWKLPDWILKYKSEIKNNLLSIDIIEEYTRFHDCGKPYCLIFDEFGKRHFPNHSAKSAEVWLQATGNLQVSKLMSLDMKIHTIKANEIDEFIKLSEVITLLTVGLAEVTSNSKMFGGFDSLSFKIKFKQINSRGNNICKKLFGEK